MGIIVDELFITRNDDGTYRVAGYTYRGFEQEYVIEIPRAKINIDTLLESIKNVKDD